jgi:anti-sigma regulatory factor (Ser/Thr protein kinase)
MTLLNTSNTLANTHQILLINDTKEIERLSNWLSNIAEQLKIPNQFVFRLDLILVETVMNIIENAYENKETHQIKVELQYIDNKVTLLVEDDGIPFNPLENPEVEFPDKLENVKIGGLGIHLIRSYSDECRYERKENKNRLTVVLYCR